MTHNKNITLAEELSSIGQSWVVISSSPIYKQFGVGLPYENNLFFFALESGRFLIVDDNQKPMIITQKEIEHISALVDQNKPIDYDVIVPGSEPCIALACLSSYLKPCYEIPKTITDYVYSRGFTRD